MGNGDEAGEEEVRWRERGIGKGKARGERGKGERNTELERGEEGRWRGGSEGKRGEEDRKD